MGYAIEQMFIKNNRSGKSLTPIGLTYHDTATPGAPAINEFKYFNRQYVGASAHFFVDWDRIIQVIPENEKAWHAGPTANSRFLSIEMCNPAGYNKAQFDAMYARAIWLGRHLMEKYHWTTKNVNSHKWCSNTWHESDHQDPDAFLAKYGKSWNQLIADLSNGTASNSTNVAGSTNDYGIAVVTAKSGLKVRKGPGQNYGEAGPALPCGKEVRISRVQGNWASIYYGTNGGWVSLDYLAIHVRFKAPEVVKATTSSGMIFRVVVESLTHKENAVEVQNKLKAHGFDSFILPFTKGETNYYRVIAGSYKQKTNAVEQQRKLQKAGFTSFLALYNK